VPRPGSLAPQAQDPPPRPGAAARRPVVLATSIAETSLTIEGVGAVVDAGLARVPRYSPRSGMTRLATIRVSRASAEQRRGRAGRLGPGICYRLWGQAEEQSLVPRGTPEILEADLAPLALDLAAAGIAGPLELSWLDPPPAGAFAEARGLLEQLGALDADGRITPHGRAMAGLSLHPRLAHMVMRGRTLGAREQACELAALLSERDLVRRQGDVPEADIRLRLDILRGRTQVAEVDREALRRARADVRSCVAAGARGEAKPLGQPGRPRTPSETSPGVLLALAYPDRIAQRRPDSTGRYLLRNGTGAFLEPQALGREEYLVAAELEGRGRESRVLLAAPITLEEILEHFEPAVQRHSEVEWDPASRDVLARKRERLGALVLREGPWPDPDPARVRAALLDGIRRAGVEALPWDEASRRLRARLAFLQRLDPEWPDVSDDALLESLEVWLGPHLEGVRRLDQLGALSLGDLLLGRVGWDRRGRVDQLAPTHLQVPSGSRVPVDYSDPDVPVLAVRLQEVFGLLETPRIAGGQVPLTLHLLSPARRPVQVTRDLAGFWRTTYFEVRKDLRGRYPRHPWPDDPLTSPPTRRA
ncbi:MAG: ATP-dependent helicase HrpB, partial [Gemmatimonadales bacterium]